MTEILYKVLPPIIILIAVISNSLVITIWSRKRFRKFYLRNIYCLEAVTSTLSVLQLIYIVMDETFDFFLQTFSTVMCKITTFLEYSIPSISAYMLIIISVERLISIRSPTFKSIEIQKILICLSVMYNFSFYVIFLYSFDSVKLEMNNSTNETLNTVSNNTGAVVKCIGRNRFHEELTSIMDLINSTIIPFILMSICSIILINYVFNARHKIKNRNAKNTQKQLNKDIQFSLTIIVLNLVFMVFNLPICVMNLIKIDSSIYLEMFFYSQYACSFIIYFCCNKIFRNEFFKILGLKKENNRNTYYMTEQ